MRPAVPLILPGPIRRRLIAHARRERPRECCGLLLGHAGHAYFMVPARNRAAGETRYQLDPRVHLDVQRVIRGFHPPLRIIGVYHSHPATQARPSPTDLAEAHYPAWVHVIVSLAGGRPRVTAWRLRAGRAVPLAIAPA